MSWQPIETAPRDKMILLYVPTTEYVSNNRTGKKSVALEKVGEGSWVDSEWRWANDSCSCCWGGIYPGAPTHWEPLPEPPA